MSEDIEWGVAMALVDRVVRSTRTVEQKRQFLKSLKVVVNAAESQSDEELDALSGTE